MLSSKLIAIAAAAALTIHQVAAKQEATHIKINVHGKHHGKQSSVCAAGESEMSVEGVEGIFCVTGQSCVADIDGECPGPQDGLEYGAYCDTVKTGVLGCKPVTEEMWWSWQGGDDSDDCTGEGESPMSVEGVEGVFCVTGQACAGVQGSCPEAQDGLEYGSYCDFVQSGVLGCKPITEHMWKNLKLRKAKQPRHHNSTAKKGPQHHKKHHTKQSSICEAGWSEMSVEGVEGIFCVQGQSCVADIYGSCPDAQDGLEYGAYCDTVKTGVLGCKPVTEEMWWSWQDEEDTTGDCTGEGESPMSVEGVEGVFCVTGQACAGVDGACPGPQAGLEYGAYCDYVQSGVLGCKPVTEEDIAMYKDFKRRNRHAHAKKGEYKPAHVKASIHGKRHHH